MPGLMDGKRGLIMGVANDHSIAWGIAKTLHQHGAQIAYTYQGDALLKRVKPLAEQTKSDIILPCDVSRDDDIDNLFVELAKHWDGLDGFVHAIAFAPRVEDEGWVCLSGARQ